MARLGYAIRHAGKMSDTPLRATGGVRLKIPRRCGQSASNIGIGPGPETQSARVSRLLSSSRWRALVVTHVTGKALIVNRRRPLTSVRRPNHACRSASVLGDNEYTAVDMALTSL